MNILAIDTSSVVASAAILCDNILKGEYTTNQKKNHSQKLMPLIDSLFKSVDISIEDIDLFAVSAGPGSFTGLRIGIATAKGLAHATGKPIIGVSSIKAMAYNLFNCADLIAVIMDARRDQVYGGIYYWKDGKLVEHTPPCAVSVDEIIEKAKNEKRKTVFIGDGIIRFGDIIKEKLGENAVISLANSNMQRASSVGILAKILYENNEAMAYDEIMPIYLRKSQAEREYDERENNSL